MRKYLGCFVLVACVLTLVSGCGSSSTASYTATSEAGKAAGDNDYEGYITAEEAVADDDVATRGNSGNTVSAGSDTSEDQKIVYTCNLDIETEEYEDTKDTIKSKISEYECIVSYENESDSDRYWYYANKSDVASMSLYLSVMVPADKYEAFVNDVSSTGKVLSKDMSADNITRTYNDTKAYVTSLETELEKLQNMMEKATEIEDMLAIEDRITEVETQLNQYKSDLDYLERNVRYSTVNISVEEVKEYTPTTLPAQTFGERITETFRESWDAFGTFWQNFLVVLIFMLPFLIIIAIVLIVIFTIIKKVKKKRAAKKNPGIMAGQTKNGTTEKTKNQVTNETPDISDKKDN